MTSRRTLCNVSGCNNNIKYNRNLSFFTLPKDEQRRNVWLRLIGRPDLMQKTDLRPASHSVCSEHFDSRMITLIPKLKPEAIPTKNLPWTRNVASTTKNTDTSESESSDSDSATSKIPESNNYNPNVTTKTVEVPMEIKKEIEDSEIVQNKEEESVLETVYVKKEEEDSVTESLTLPVSEPVPVNIKVEKSDSDNEQFEAENSELGTTIIVKEEHDSETEISDSIPLQPPKTFAENPSDTPSTSSYRSSNESKLKSRATQKILKIKKSKNKKIINLPLLKVPAKRSLKDFVDSKIKRRKV